MTSLAKSISTKRSLSIWARPPMPMQRFKHLLVHQRRFGIGTPCAYKLWVNGQPAGEREVYHSGNEIDQYSHSVELKSGENQLLLKVCQNEQTESWAQDWEFQLRVTDELGGAISVASFGEGNTE